MKDVKDQVKEQVKGQVAVIASKRMYPVFVIAGFTVSFLFAAVWIIAATLNGEWIFGFNALSDLGVCETDASKIIFNYGCVLTGVAGFLFGYGLLSHERTWLAATGLFTMIGTVFLMGVGAIPESFIDPHKICAGMFGAMSVVAMLTSAVGDYKKGRKKYTAISIALLLVCGIMVPFDFGYFEAIAIICILVWVGTQSFKYSKIIGKIDYTDPLMKFFEEDNKRTSKSDDNKG